MTVYKEMRKQKNMTQSDVAQAVNVNRTTVVKWETGKACPRIETLQKLAVLFQCSMEELLQTKTPPT